MALAPPADGVEPVVVAMSVIALVPADVCRRQLQAQRVVTRSGSLCRSTRCLAGTLRRRMVLVRACAAGFARPGRRIMPQHCRLRSVLRLALVGVPLRHYEGALVPPTPWQSLVAFHQNHHHRSVAGGRRGDLSTRLATAGFGLTFGHASVTVNCGRRRRSPSAAGRGDRRSTHACSSAIVDCVLPRSRTMPIGPMRRRLWNRWPDGLLAGVQHSRGGQHHSGACGRACHADVCRAPCGRC